MNNVPIIKPACISHIRYKNNYFYVIMFPSARTSQRSPSNGSNIMVSYY
jgi:hypothetical protein